MNKRQELEIYYKGKEDGIWLYSWMKDGVYFVGTTGRTRQEALEELHNQHELELNKFGLSLRDINVLLTDEQINNYLYGYISQVEYQNWIDEKLKIYEEYECNRNKFLKQVYNITIDFCNIISGTPENIEKILNKLNEEAND